MNICPTLVQHLSNALLITVSLSSIRQTVGCLNVETQYMKYNLRGPLGGPGPQVGSPCINLKGSIGEVTK